MTLDPRAAAYSAKDLGRRLRWIEDRLKYLGSSRGLLDRGSVTGGAVTITEILTSPADTTNGFWNTDYAVITGPGDLTDYLTYVPLPGSLHVHWIPNTMSQQNWTLVDNIVTVTDPGWRAGDLVEFAYAYDPTVAALAPIPGPLAPGSTAIVDFEAPGWKFLQLARLDATDYKSPTFDDSAWATEQGAFGEDTPSGYISSISGWPMATTVWNQNTRMWIRRTLTMDPTVNALLTVRLNKSVNVYFNGVKVFYWTSDGGSEGGAVVPASRIAASTVVAIQVTDDTISGPHSGCYFDIKVTQ